ncbi:MAG: hypothetical protein A2020_13740 [Lentisphaerae bacterium GWF2_45_14]|nr:MAG: hypothetical protein A2020_13740 [Lentisphaerae bacterium GWF2_45_14]
MELFYTIEDMVISLKDYALLQFESRTIYNWVFFFFPLVVFVEIPRYFIPSLLLPFLHYLGVKTGNQKAEREFMKRKPSVSIIVAGRNEEKVIGSTIESLLNLPYENKEIIVVDDNSNDKTYAICREYARKGLIRLFRNNSKTGRAGRPVASNFGFRVSTGEFIISVDADTSYDFDIIEKMIGPFHDRKVGAVAGNLKVRNISKSIWTNFQAVEYLISIGLWKRWTGLFNVTMQASGAFGAFRREAILDFKGWDPELAEDADISLKVRKCGWNIVFAPYAIAMTTVPENLKTLVKQRVRWDKGTVRTYFHKHGDMLRAFWRYRFGEFYEIFMGYMMDYIFPFVYVIYLTIMCLYSIQLLVFALFAAYMLYIVMTFVTLFSVISFSERRSEEWRLLWYAPVFPFYKEIFRWVRLYANIMETFRWKYKESYIPESGYKETTRW